MTPGTSAPIHSLSPSRIRWDYAMPAMEGGLVGTPRTLFHIMDLRRSRMIAVGSQAQAMQDPRYGPGVNCPKSRRRCGAAAR